MVLIRRHEMGAWVPAEYGDEAYDLLTRVIATDGFVRSHVVAGQVLELVAAHPYPELRFTQLGIRDWHVQVTMSAPRGLWWNDRLQNLVASIDERWPQA